MLRISSTFARDMTKEGWGLLEDVDEPSSISIADLGLVSFFKDGESYVRGEEMVKRAEKFGANLGQRHAELLLDHQNQIPKEWRDYYLVFPGTIWRGRDGDRYVQSLCWLGTPWNLGFLGLGLDWPSGGRLVRPCKSGVGLGG